MNLRITVLGSGTSAGVPTVGCACPVCHSSDPRDTRLRPSILISYPDAAANLTRNIVVDTTPDFRAQVLRSGITRLDAVVYTHSHADHILGLDDVRPFNAFQRAKIPIWASAKSLATIERVFAYVFEENLRRGFIPKLEVNIVDGQPFRVLDLDFQPIPVMHGSDSIFGFRFGGVAYLTDHSEIPESSMELLEGLDVLFLDALRHKPHPTHSTVETSIATAQRLRPKRTFFTHISHDLGHAETQEALPANIYLAYDGLEIEVPGSL